MPVAESPLLKPVMRRQQHGLLQRGEEAPVGSGVLDGGHPALGVGADDDRRLRREKVGIIFRAHNLIPFLIAALDTGRGKAVMDLFRRLGRERGAAVIVVTHDERMLEGSDRIYHMVDGKITNN